MTPRMKQLRFRRMVKRVAIDVGVALIVYTPIIAILVHFFTRNGY